MPPECCGQFVLPRHRILNVMPVGEDHLRVAAGAADGSRIEAMAFRARSTELGAVLPAMAGRSAHLAVNLSLDHYGGRERVQARLVDAARAD